MRRRWGLVGQATTGVEGFAKASRTIPVLLDIARDIQQLCADAWLINFSNPSGLVTEALQRHAPENRSAGLCNSPIGHQMMVVGQLGVSACEVELEYLGLNHLSCGKVSAWKTPLRSMLRRWVGRCGRRACRLTSSRLAGMP